MTFADIAPGQTVFLDANPLVEHFATNMHTGPACTAMLERVASGEIHAYTSAHVLGEMAHRLLTFEACATFGWPYKGITQRLANHPAEITKLYKYRQAIDEVPYFGVQVLPVLPHHVPYAGDLMRQHGLLFNDGLVAALMADHGLLHLASSDADFDRVPGLTRYAAI